MGKLREFSIQLANNTDVFMPGQWITGQVTVDLNDEMKMRGIRLKFQGKGHVGWTETHRVGSGEHARTEHRHYRADETYFNQEVTLFGKASGQSGDNPTLGAGHHVYPFQYQLPLQGLPTSFEGSNGYIRYSVRGTIDKPWKFDHTTKRAFTVLDMVDLNQEPNAMTPLTGQQSKTLCCLCCASGPIELQVQADRSAYCPGESIIIRGSVENNSSSKITKVTAKLKQDVVFHAHHPHQKTRHVTKILGDVDGSGCEEGGSVDLNITLPVPAIPPSSLRSCSIIDLSYTLDVSAHFGGAHTSLDLTFPILVGSIPLRSIYPVAPAFPPPSVAPGFDPAFPPPNPGAYPPPNPGAVYPPPAGPDAAYPPVTGAPYVPPGDGVAPPIMPPADGSPNLPPPAYMQSVFGANNIRDDDDNEYTRGTLDYAPKYPYYDWSQHPQV
ncbi:arrestin domain-containing protein 3-like [Branchiostoma floridae]|uniref:Arrestin domain-containing protein 3-like n=1 Tax=Branchiostoma floridae TaxID=7739 RepID=A0A9J7HGG0_BRAFL|nr:arrestin domain-containing protein 3-like [Branchiostoma floridae]